MGSIGPLEVLVVLVVALLVLGPEKLPGAARSLGRAIGEVRRYTTGFQEEMRDAFADPEPPPTEPPTTEPWAARPSTSEASQGEASQGEASTTEASTTEAPPSEASTSKATSGVDGATVTGAPAEQGNGDSPSC